MTHTFKNIKGLFYPFFMIAIMGGLTPAMGQLAAYETKPGTERPHDTYFDQEKKQQSLSAFKGRITIVNYWASWCGPCVAEMPSLHQLSKVFPKDHLAIVTICMDLEKTQDNAMKMMAPFETLHKGLCDREKTEHFLKSLYSGDGYRLPTTIILDRSGYIIGTLKGATLWDHHEIVDLIQNYIDGKTPKPMGFMARIVSFFKGFTS